MAFNETGIETGIFKEINVRDNFYVELLRSAVWAGLSHNAKSVYPVLRAYVDPETNTGSPTLDTLSDGTGLPNESVVRGINELIKEGLATKWGWLEGKNVYSIINRIPVHTNRSVLEEVKLVMKDKSSSESDKLRKIDEIMDRNLNSRSRDCSTVISSADNL